MCRGDNNFIPLHIYFKYRVQKTNLFTSVSEYFLKTIEKITPRRKIYSAREIQISDFVARREDTKYTFVTK